MTNQPQHWIDLLQSKGCINEGALKAPEGFYIEFFFGNEPSFILDSAKATIDEFYITDLSQKYPKYLPIERITNVTISVRQRSLADKLTLLRSIASEE